LLQKEDRQSVLRMSIGSEFQTLGAATLNTPLAVCLSACPRNKQAQSTATVRRGTAGQMSTKPYMW